jgi:hypothetical protein
VTDAGTQALTTVVLSAALALSAVPAACSAQTVQSYPPIDKTPHSRDGFAGSNDSAPGRPERGVTGSRTWPLPAVVVSVSPDQVPGTL